MVHDNPTIDGVRSDRPTKFFSCLSGLCESNSSSTAYWRALNSAARRRATVGTAAAVPASFTVSASMARRTVEGEARLRSGSDRLAIHSTSWANSMGMSASSMGW